MRTTLILSLVLALTPAAFSATILVPADYLTIQEALDSVSNGDVIVVSGGTYLENLDFSGKEVTLESEFGPGATTIDGGQTGSAVIFQNGEGAGTVLSGFRIINGSAMNGGGIYCSGSSPTIVDNVITGNSADAFGGGIFCLNASPDISGNTISGNQAVWSGGGIYLDGSFATLVRNKVMDNIGDWGGGIYLSDSPVTLDNIKIGGNSASFGGAIHCRSSSATLSNTTLVGNTAGYFGGGIDCQDSTVTVINSILWNNSAMTGKEVHLGSLYNPSNLTISYCDVEGGEPSVYVTTGSLLDWGSNMIDSDPLFAAIDDDDYHLTYYSPCMNAGYNFAPTIATLDFEGDPRIAGGVYGTVDMGADEFYLHLYFTGTPKPDETIDVKVVGPPGMTPVTIGVSDSPLIDPIPTQFGMLYLQMPFTSVDLGVIPQDGVLVYEATIPSVWASGSQHCMQALVNMELTNPVPLPIE